MFIQEGGYPFVAKAFGFHQATPMTAGVANVKEDWFVLGDGCLEGLWAPWPPIDQVVGVSSQED